MSAFVRGYQGSAGKPELHVRLSRESECRVARLRLTLRVFLKWTTLFFLVVESLALIGHLLVLASKIGHWNEALNQTSWGQVALELTLRFAIVGLIVSAYLRLEALSKLPPTITRQSALLATRAVQSILLATIALCALVAERITGHAYPVPNISRWTILALTFGTVIPVLISRRKLLFLANEKLRRDPHDADALSQWRRITIFSMFIAVSIAAYGFILRMMGNGRILAWPFFFVAATLLFLWRPRMDDGSSSPANPFSDPNTVKSR